MTLEDFVHRVETRLLGIGRLFWPSDPLAAHYDALDRIEVQAQRRRRELAAAEADRKSVQTRLDDRHAAADLLKARVEATTASGDSTRAWNLALELDRIHQEITEDEKRLRTLDQVVWSLQFAVRQLERERSRIEKHGSA